MGSLYLFFTIYCIYMLFIFLVFVFVSDEFSLDRHSVRIITRAVP